MNTIKCPDCSEASTLHQIARPEYPRFAPQVLGGIGMALVFELSRKRRFHCDRCGVVFDRHTAASRLGLAVWTFLWFMVVFTIWNLSTH